MRLIRSKLMKVTGLLAVLALIAVGCGAAGGSGSSGGGTLSKVDLSGANFTVGSKDFTEQLILGQITVQALEATGANVKDQTNLAGTDAARAALVNGNIDMYWEYTGTNWINHLKHTTPLHPAKKQYEAVKKEELKKNNIVVMQRAKFNNTYALAMRSEAPKKVPALKDVTKLSDIGPLIKNHPKDATLCVESEFKSRDDGLPGMEKKYGYKFPNKNVSLFDTGVVYNRTDKGNPCNFGEVFTTDGRIKALDLTVLKDDKEFFPIYNPAVNIRKSVYDKNPKKLDKVFTPIAKALDTKTMQKLNAEVDVKGQLPEDVAKQWLQDNGFTG